MSFKYLLEIYFRVEQDLVVHHAPNLPPHRMSCPDTRDQSPPRKYAQGVASEHKLKEETNKSEWQRVCPEHEQSWYVK